jgi:hypothetical protein
MEMGDLFELFDESGDGVCGLLWFPLQDQVGAVDRRHANIRFDALNFFPAGLRDDLVLCGLDVKNGHGYMA